MLKGKKIVLGVTGGIAVYKAVDLVSRLRKRGCQVRVVMTEHAQQFVTPLTFKEISGNQVAVSMWSANQEFNVEHIALANWADAFLVAPATANIIAKMTYGLADDLLSTTLLAAQADCCVSGDEHRHVRKPGYPSKYCQAQGARRYGYAAGGGQASLRHQRCRSLARATGDCGVYECLLR